MQLEADSNIARVILTHVWCVEVEQVLWALGSSSVVRSWRDSFNKRNARALMVLRVLPLFSWRAAARLIQIWIQIQISSNAFCQTHLFPLYPSSQICCWRDMSLGITLSLWLFKLTVSKSPLRRKHMRASRCADAGTSGKGKSWQCQSRCGTNARASSRCCKATASKQCCQNRRCKQTPKLTVSKFAVSTKS